MPESKGLHFVDQPRLKEARCQIGAAENRYVLAGALLNWDQSTDNADPQSAIEYELYLNGRFFDLTPPGASSAGVYTAPGTNTWTVVAVDRSGNSSAASNAVTVTIVADQNLC